MVINNTSIAPILSLKKKKTKTKTKTKTKVPSKLRTKEH
jgi:hypothetical protein